MARTLEPREYSFQLKQRKMLGIFRQAQVVAKYSF